MSPLQSKDAALFVYLSWKTRNGNPLLACDQIRQATCLAIVTRLRLQFCHVLSFKGTPSQIHLIVRFPASFPISTIVRVGQDAAKYAIVHWLETYEGRSLDTKPLWERQYTVHTLRLRNSAEANTYLQQIICGKNETNQENGA